MDESGPVRRFGFAYGTLPGHAESGEERFLIEWDQDEDGVWFDILAFSRPAPLPGPAGLPVGAARAEAVRSGVGCRHASSRC